MTRSPSKVLSGLKRHNQWLMLIAAFKFMQATLFIAIGVGARRLLHKDVGDELNRLVDHLHFNPEWQLVHFALNKASLVNDHLLRRIGLGAFCYAGLEIAEGIGLYLEKTWGEYLTLLITASFLPWEILEIVHRLTWVRLSLLVINVAVFVYLLKLVVEQQRTKRGFKGRKRR